MTRPRLLIRADASAEIGTGHVMRCLALAQTWQDYGGEVTFACISLPPALGARLKAETIAVRMLDVLAGSADDAGAAIALAQDIGAETVVVDGYIFGAAYQRHIKDAGLRLLFVDDNGHAEHYYADFVLNQNVQADESLYAKREPYTRLLLGVGYTLLRREFRVWRSWERPPHPVARFVLVTMGGSDPQNVTLRVIDALRGLPFVATVVVGGGNPNLDAIQRAADDADMYVKVNVEDMPSLMAESTIAVTAAGSTCWEMAFMGLPSIALVIADNQRGIAARLAAMQMAVVPDENAQSSEIRQAIIDLAGDFERRRAMSLIGQATIDGWGAQRTAAVLRGDGGSRLRPAESSDCGLIWLWANDPQTRANSFNAAPIPWETHVDWFARQLASPDVRFWVLEDSAAPVGHIRYQASADGKTAAINYTVGPSYRGKGYGTRLLIESAEHACRELKVETLEGMTFAENIASASAFRSAGFMPAETRQIEGRDCVVFQWRY